MAQVLRIEESKPSERATQQIKEWQAIENSRTKKKQKKKRQFVPIPKLPVAKAPWGAVFESKPWLEKYADEMRQNPTKAERALNESLTQELENRGIVVLPQFPVDSYILDLFIPEKLVAIEVDGWYHYTPEQWDKDLTRTNKLRKSKGIRIIRFDNEEVTKSLKSVIRRIIKFCDYA